MPHAQIDVLLISDDERLRAQVARHKPAAARLHCTTSQQVTAQRLTASQYWIDLATFRGVVPEDGQRRVYFYSQRRPVADAFPPGFYVRKPCSGTVLGILWSGVAAPREIAAVRAPAAALPGWVLEFQELQIRTLCHRVVNDLRAYLGYRSASLYLYDGKRRLLTLAETTHERPVDHVVNLGARPDSLMTAVACGGHFIRTTQATRTSAERGVALCAGREYADDHCLIAPLFADQTLIGVLNLAERDPEIAELDDPTLMLVLTFLGRALDHARRYEQVKTEARVDPLTGLFNHRWMEEALTREIRRAERFESPLAILMLDIDGLKAINDREGHAAGDCLLRHVARCISGVLRRFDGAARMGGDEFVAMLPGTDIAGAAKVGRRLIKTLRDHVAHFRDRMLPITASIGAAQWIAGWSSEKLLEVADRAMYAAKHHGRDKLVCHEVAALPPAQPTQASSADAKPADAGSR